MLIGEPLIQNAYQTDGWEYGDIVLTFSPKSGIYCRIGDDADCHTTAKWKFWDICEVTVRQSLRPLLDQGWQPVEEINWQRLTCKTYTTVKWSPLGWVVNLVIIFLTLGISLFLFWETYDEPTQVRIQMRRIAQ